MRITQRVAGMMPMVALLMGTHPAASQDYPSRPIRIITSSAGSGSDFASRTIAQGLTASVGQPVIVDNRPSAIAAEVAAKAQGDGHTLLLDSNSLWLTLLLQKMPYDVLKDFTAVTLAATSPNILVAPPVLAANSIKEVIALAKAKSGTLNYGSTGSGSSQHLAMELFKSMAGIHLLHVPYKGIAQAYTDMFSGEVHLMFPNASSATPHIKSGRLKALAVTSPEPSPLVPGVPAIAASGLPGYEWLGRSGLFMSGKPPEAVVNKLNREIVRVVRLPEVKEKFLNIGVETLGNSPAEFAAIVQSEIIRMGKVIKAAGIRAD
jgi:tripartite-type tricarboxylate transporter receptor subunit TctC